MLINTRNFFLYLLCVGFLVIAIVATFSRQNPNRDETVSTQTVTVSEEVVYTAQVTEGNIIDREGNLASLRNRISALPKSEVTKPPVIVEEPVIATPGVKSELIECSDYVAPKAFKLAPGVQFEVVEGARIVYYDVEVPLVLAATNTTMIMSKEVVLQLPIRSFPMTTKTCLPYDVVGIAKDGSPIRNQDVSLYSIFGQETLVGYALDGFLIFGQSDSLELDECGGTMVNNEYRYYLSKERQTILSCYSGVPIKI